MKKLCLVLLLVLTMVMPKPEAYASTVYEIKIPDYTFMVFSEPLEDFPVLAVNGTNYIPIKVAASFFGFHLSIYEDKPNVIELLYGLDENAEAINNEMLAFTNNTARTIQPSTHEIFYNGQPMGAPLLNIDGYNFIQLEHATIFFGYNAYTHEETKTVIISNDPIDALSKEEQAVYRDYFQQNAIPIDMLLSGKQDTFDGIGLENYSVYLIGENHAVAANYGLYLYFIRYLYENQGVRHIISENGYCDAQLLNRYLQTGDAGILDNMMKNLEGTFAYSKDLRRFYEDVYAYNKTLPEQSKLQFIGIDLQHQTLTGIDYLLSLIQNAYVNAGSELSSAPDIVKESYNTLEAAKETDTYVPGTYYGIKDSLIANMDVFEQSFQADYDHFKRGLATILQKPEYKCDNEREKMMIQNFIYQYEEIDSAKSFGMFGGFHTTLNSQLDREGKEHNLATHLNTYYEKTKNKIASFTVMYYECFSMDKETGAGAKMQVSGVTRMMAEAVESDFSLFPLEKEGSVFIKDGSTKSQQYLLLIKNSAAAERYSNN